MSPDKHKLEIEPQEKIIVEYIFENYLKGESTYSLVEKVRKKFKCELTPTKIKYMLQNPIYKGSVAYGRVKKQSFKSKKRVYTRFENLETVEDAQPAIISKECFASVQESFKKRRRKPKDERIQNPLSGLIKCGDCGESLILKQTSRKKLKKGENPLTNYKFFCASYNKNKSCTAHRMPATDLIDVVFDEIRKQAEKAVSGELIEELKKSVQSPQKDGIKRRKKEISDVQKDVESVQSRLRKSFESYADGMSVANVQMVAYPRGSGCGDESWDWGHDKVDFLKGWTIPATTGKNYFLAKYLKTDNRYEVSYFIIKV